MMSAAGPDSRKSKHVEHDEERYVKNKWQSVGPVALLISASLPGAAFADASRVVKSWRTDHGWLTELRQHDNGARVCATGKAFRDGRPFGLSIVKSGEVTLITLVDEGQPPERGAKMELSAAGQPVGSLAVTIQGPAFATSEGESRKTWALVRDLPAGPLSIDVGGRQYLADLAGIGLAREQLKSCEQEAAG
jgi:hypothetical protein